MLANFLHVCERCRGGEPRAPVAHCSCATTLVQAWVLVVQCRLHTQLPDIPVDPSQDMPWGCPCWEYTHACQSAAMCWRRGNCSSCTCMHMQLTVKQLPAHCRCLQCCSSVQALSRLAACLHVLARCSSGMCFLECAAITHASGSCKQLQPRLFSELYGYSARALHDHMEGVSMRSDLLCLSDAGIHSAAP